MLINVSLLKDERDGKATWRLLGPDGLQVDAFAAFADSLLRKHPFNTRKAYCRHLANFFDYLFEVELALGNAYPGEPLTRALLRKIIEAYDDYLVKGGDSGHEIAKLVNKTKPSPRHSSQTSALMHAPLRKFLSMSEQLRQELQEDSLLSIVHKGPADASPLFTRLHTKRNVTLEQHHAMTVNSMISGVISGGPKFLKSTVLPTISEPPRESWRLFGLSQAATVAV